MGSTMRRVPGAGVMVAVTAALGVLAAEPASAEFTIRAARIAAGDLWVIGQVDEPNTVVTLDDTYTEITDSRGRFQFRTAYHPATCTVILKTEKASRAVVVGNCGQRGPAGSEARGASEATPPPGPAGGTAPAGPNPAPGPPLLSPNSLAPIAGAPRDQPLPPAAAPSLPVAEAAGPATEVACEQKAALYAAANGFRLWITRRGTLAYVNSLKDPPEQRDAILEVSINGNLASLRGEDPGRLTRGGAPQEVAAGVQGALAWEGKLERLPRVLQVLSETGGGVAAHLAFQECGTAPRTRAPRPPPQPTQPSRPLPQGALP